MPDPLERLARFTPAPVPNRAALLLAAGRASAPRVRPWQMAAALLLLTNLLTLALWLRPRPTPPPVVEPPPPMESPVEPLAEGSYGRLVRQWEQGEPPLTPAADPNPPQPPLTVASRQSW